MPQTNRSSQVRSNSQYTRSELKKIARPAFPRDDLREAFAGDENKGPAKKQKTSTAKDTHLKSRRTDSSKKKTPIR